MAAPILNDRDLVLQNSAYRSKNTLVTVTADAGAFLTAKNGGATSPSNVVLTATPNNVYTSSAVYTWHYALSATPTVWVLLGTGITRTILNTDLLAIIGSSTQVQYRCTVTENLLDTAYGFFTVLYSKEASEPIVVDISRINAVIPCSSEGVPTGYSNTDTTISVSRGGVALVYNANGGVANTFKVTIQTDNVARTLGDITISTNTYGISGITNIAVDVATVVFVVTVYDASGVITSPTIAKKITYTKVTNGVKGDSGVKGDQGIQGNPGQRSVTINAYKWVEGGAAVGDFSASITYTWADKSISGYPEGWSATATAPNATTIGLRLYQLSLLVTDLTGTALTNTLNWSAATTNTIGYRLDGSIGPQGNSARVAYTVTTINTPPIAPGSGAGDNAVPIGRSTTTTPADPNYPVAPTWSFNATSTLSPGQYMYQCDGILVTGGNITWGNPYLSNLKVGSLDAISANLGVINTGTLTAGTIFAGDITGASGNFSGTISGAKGEFAGTLRAGVVDLSSFAGVSYTFSSPGDADKTVPSGKTSMRVTLIGAGGGGGAGSSRPIEYSGAGGGGGGLITQVFSGLTPGAVISIAIGAGGTGAGAYDPGTGQTVGAAGTAGGSTSVYYNGSLYATATGGGGGGGATVNSNYGIPQGGSSGGLGGSVGSNGIYAIFYNSAFGGYDTGVVNGGTGGASRYGSGGRGGIANSGTLATVGGIGGGGGGGGTNWNNNNLGAWAANGGPGYAIIEFFDPNTVVLKSEFDVLKSALSRQGIAVI